MFDHLVDNARSFPAQVAGNATGYAKLAEGQRPWALFVSCSDSRVVPAAITGAGPGDLFELRNAGAIVPEYVPGSGCAVAGTIEFALTCLDIRHIVVCGHSHCAAVKGLQRPGGLPGAVTAWLDRSPRKAESAVPDTSAGLVHAGQDHVVRQLSALRTHPAVRARLDGGSLSLTGWFYRIDSGVISRCGTDGTFGPL